MSTPLMIGSKVSFLKDIGQGTILKIENDQFLIRDENGFENWYNQDEIVPRMQVSDEKLLADNAIHKRMGEKHPAIKPKFKKKIVESKIDLHMENLVSSHKGMTNHEILLIQLSHFKQFLQRTELDKVSRIVVVHGLGTGKLKAEIQTIIKDIKGAEMFDADYLTYGQGASIIERRYNIR